MATLAFMYKSIFALLFIFIFSVEVFSQNTFSISGKVKDDQGGLPGAGVYLSGYKLATVADNDGNFMLPNLKPGSYNILVQMVGYLPFSKSVIIEDKSVKVDLLLKENTVLLNEVTIRADPNRPKYIKQFTEYFIGTTPNSKQCKILNPQVLIVDFDVTKSLLTVKTTEFLIVENKALGYKLKYMLDYFEYNSRTHIIYFSGHPFFEEFKASPAKKKKYIEAREVAYYGSSQHFFRSLYENKSKEEGFIINKIIQTPNPNRYPENLINENLVKIRTLPEKTGIRKEAGKIDAGLLEFWTKQKEMPRFIDKFSRAEVNPDTLVRYFNENLKWINYTDALCVQYTKEKESLAYSNTGFWVFRPLDIPEHEISVVKLTDGPVRFYSNGSVYDSRSMLYEGYWAYEKVGDMVRMDYIPIARK